MKIQNINLNTYKNNSGIIQNKKEKNNPDFSLQNYSKINNRQLLAFRGIEINSQFPIELEKFCNKKGKVTKEEYREIKKTNPQIIKKAQEYSETYTGRLTPNKIASFSYVIKHRLDEKYNNNYRIISIGTSPYPYAQTMEYLGANVAYIPISEMSYFDEDFDTPDNCANLKAALRYLKEQLKKMPSDENTKNIIIDYTFTGSTLQAVKNLIISNNITPKNSTKALSIDALFFDLGEKETEIFEQICEGAKDDRKMLEHVYFDSEKDMIENKIADLSNIPHNKYNTGEYTPYEEKVKKFNEYSQPLARCFNLCILNELDKIKLHLENSI